MTTWLWVCTGAFAYLGVGTTLTVLCCGLSEAIRRRQFPAEAIGPTIALWPVTFVVAALVTFVKSAAMGIRLIRSASPSVARIAAAEEAGAVRERGRVLALISEERRRAAQLQASEPLLAEWTKAFDHVSLAVADGARRKSVGRDA